MQKSVHEGISMKIIFVRHGKDDDRFRGGWSEMDLIPQGVNESMLLAKHFEKNKDFYNISYIISSDLPRTLSTASYVSDVLDLSVLKDERIREINNGDLSGMLNEEALIKYPGLFFNTLQMDESYPNGESPKDFYSRIKNWFDDFILKYQNIDGNVLVVTHSGVINIIYHIVKNIDWSNKTKPFKVSNCSIHILNTDTMEFEIENKIDFI